MPTIDDLPTRPPMGQDFGQAFNYSVWTPNTTIELCRVPWNSDYRDIVKFDSRAALDTYLDSTVTAPVTITKMTYARVGDPVRVNLPFNQVYGYNYIRVNNPAQPIDGDSGRSYYYFITDVRYLAPNTTEIQIQLDVWQTFNFDVTFGNCYIERGHIGIANTKSRQFENMGRDLLTVPEGLDIGDEYTINNVYMTGVNTTGAENGLGCWIMMGIGADISKDPGTADDPKLVTSGGTSVEGFPQGCDIVIFKSTNDFTNTMAAFKEAPWVTETIQFIMAIPPVKGADTMMQSFTPYGAIGGALGYHLRGLYNHSYDTTIKSSWRVDAANNIPVRYQVLTKFLTYPYTMVELTTYTGQPLVLKPELMPDDDIVVTTKQHISPPSPRWAIIPKHYNAKGPGGAADDGEYLDFACYLTDFPQFTVQNNGYLNYLAANRNQIQYQYQSANWDYSRAMQGNQ